MIVDTPPALKVIQTLVGVMLGGLIVASAAMFLVPSRAQTSDPMVLKILLGVGGAILIGGQIIAVLIRRRYVAKAAFAVTKEQHDAGRVAACIPHFQSATILGAAFAEGPGLIGAVTVMITGSPYGLVLPALAALVLAATFPTADRLQRFVEDASGVRKL